jgi:hypothetical protein
VTPMLQRLAALRRQREQRALEALSVQTVLLRRAEQEAADAARAVQAHIRQTGAKERALIGALAGRPVSAAAILRIQLELDGSVLETGRRRAAEARARVDVASRLSTHAASLADFQLRQRARAKIDLLSKEHRTRQTLRDVALSDAETEDQSAAAAGRLP